MVFILKQIPGGRLNIKMSSYQYRDSHVKDKRSCDRLIFNMGIPIPVRDGLYIETGPWLLQVYQVVPSAKSWQLFSPISRHVRVFEKESLTMKTKLSVQKQKLAFDMHKQL